MIVRRITAGAAIAALAALGAAPLLAQTARETVGAQLKVVIDTKTDEGFAADTGAIGRATVMGVLEHDTTVYLELTLEAGREYYIAGRCDPGCTDLDTRLLAPDFSPIAEDTLDSDVPNITVIPPTAGPHLLAVRMTSCTTDICYFGVAVVSRPAR